MKRNHESPTFTPLTPEEMKAVRSVPDFQYSPCSLTKKCSNGKTISCSTDEDGAKCTVGYAGSGTNPVAVQCGSMREECNSGTSYDNIRWAQEPIDGSKL